MTFFSDEDAYLNWADASPDAHLTLKPRLRANCSLLYATVEVYDDRDGFTYPSLKLVELFQKSSASFTAPSTLPFVGSAMVKLPSFRKPGRSSRRSIGARGNPVNGRGLPSVSSLSANIKAPG